MIAGGLRILLLGILNNNKLKAKKSKGEKGSVSFCYTSLFFRHSKVITQVPTLALHFVLYLLSMQKLFLTQSGHVVFEWKSVIENQPKPVQ